MTGNYQRTKFSSGNMGLKHNTINFQIEITRTYFTEDVSLSLNNELESIIKLLTKTELSKTARTSTLRKQTSFTTWSRKIREFDKNRRQLQEFLEIDNCTNFQGSWATAREGRQFGYFLLECTGVLPSIWHNSHKHSLFTQKFQEIPNPYPYAS